MILEVSASQLSLGTVGDDVARVHRAMQGIGRSVPVSETASRVQKRLVEGYQVVAGRGHCAVFSGQSGGPMFGFWDVDVGPRAVAVR